MHLPHASYCAASGKCACIKQEIATLVEDPSTGKRLPKRTTKLIPSTLRLMAGSTAGKLPEAVLQAPEVKAAITNKLVADVTPKVKTKTKVQAPSEAAKPETAAPEGAAPEAADPKAARRGRKSRK